ncbi:ammonium transporter [Kamptonema cortianum]|nr:ammonium transporter [Kamptonema cortianum]MDL5046165.1 ammonium transporter [Oscillatoria amoena NRMC-F 0135]
METLKPYMRLLLIAGLCLLSAGAFAQEATEAAPEAVVTETVVAVAAEAPAEEEGPSYKDYDEFAASPGFTLFTVNNLWICIAAAFVFLMHLGFATLESGLTQAKNTVNVLFKNVFIVLAGILLYAFYGFNAMYPGDFNGYFAFGSWFGLGAAGLDDPAMTTEMYNAGYTWWGDFIFQAMFAATAATIVSGAVAERVKLGSFMIFAVILVGFLYPITGSWKWGGGWLDAAGFYDFAGSSIVHGFGGFAALACVIVLGARKGKYLENGKIKPILGHSMPLATIGVFLLFLGWFGFNGGSVLSADPKLVSFVFVTTALAACAGGIAAIALSWILLKKPDLSMALNGILAGLVGITAGADTISELNSIIVGLIAGIIVVIAIFSLDKIKIDDPVGAISVHGICGIWGTLAVGIFSMNEEHTLGAQLLGTVSICLFAFITSLIVFLIIKAIFGVRVSPEEESEGLDIGEHGQEAYPDFQEAASKMS